MRISAATLDEKTRQKEEGKRQKRNGNSQTEPTHDCRRHSFAFCLFTFALLLAD
jgi:hypothetical protein